MAEGKEPGSGLDLGKIRIEIDVIIFTLLLNLGFLKITEVSTFLGQITESIHRLDLFPIMLISVSVVAYIVYGAAILVGLIQAFKLRNARPAMVVALFAFFAMYSCVFMNAVLNAQLKIAPAAVAAQQKALTTTP